MYTSYSGKSQTNSNIVWHQPQSATSRVEDELMEKSGRALSNTSDPLEKLRLHCLARGASGIMGLGRIFRRMADEGGNRLNKHDFFTGIKDTGLEISEADAESLFAQFETDHRGYISVDDFIRQIRPSMSDGRQAIVEQVFRKLDKTGDGVIATDDIRRLYSCNSDSRYKSGEDSAELIINKFLANFESEGTVGGQVTLEEFMNFYSGISVSIDNDCYFNLMMRQAYKL